MNLIFSTPKTVDIFNDVRRGLAQNEFFLVFQPKVRIHEGQLSGFEALMRWQHPTRGTLEPSAFISVVEDSELSGQFTALLLEGAVHTLVDWTSRGHDELTLAINLPATEISRPDLPETLRKIVSRWNLKPNRLQIELTGVVEPSLLDLLADAIDAVRATSVSVALDDFGAGFTSLTLLHQLPVDILKIAPSYLSGVPGEAEPKFILETLIQLAQRLGKQIVLEGVETEAQYNWARDLPLVECQGYFISAPVLESHVEQFIAQHEAFYSNQRADGYRDAPAYPGA